MLIVETSLKTVSKNILLQSVRPEQRYENYFRRKKLRYVVEDDTQKTSSRMSLTSGQK